MTPNAWPQRVAIVGVGLIGGSLGLAIRERHPDVRVVGVDRDEDTLERARDRGAIHEGHRSLSEGAVGADLVVLATPVSAILEHLNELPSILDADALVTDVGSTKRAICQRGHDALGERFVGGHPLAGSERTGVDAARADLFQSRIWALTPENDGEPPTHLSALIENLGATVMPMTSKRHDRVVAATSHLPQLLSVALGARLADDVDHDDRVGRLISSGGADWLRLARSPSALWRDVVATNADFIHDEIRTLVTELERLDGDLQRLDEAFRRAQRLRDRLSGTYPGATTCEVTQHGRDQQGATD